MLDSVTTPRCAICANSVSPSLSIPAYNTPGSSSSPSLCERDHFLLFIDLHRLRTYPPECLAPRENHARVFNPLVTRRRGANTAHLGGKTSGSILTPASSQLQSFPLPASRLAVPTRSRNTKVLNSIHIVFRVGAHYPKPTGKVVIRLQQLPQLLLIPTPKHALDLKADRLHPLHRPTHLHQVEQTLPRLDSVHMVMQHAHMLYALR